MNSIAKRAVDLFIVGRTKAARQLPVNRPMRIKLPERGDSGRNRSIGLFYCLALISGQKLLRQRIHFRYQLTPVVSQSRCYGQLPGRPSADFILNEDAAAIRSTDGEVAQRKKIPGEGFADRAGRQITARGIEQLLRFEPGNIDAVGEPVIFLPPSGLGLELHSAAARG